MFQNIFKITVVEGPLRENCETESSRVSKSPKAWVTGRQSIRFVSFLFLWRESLHTVGTPFALTQSPFLDTFMVSDTLLRCTS